MASIACRAGSGILYKKARPDFITGAGFSISGALSARQGFFELQADKLPGNHRRHKQENARVQ